MIYTLAVILLLVGGRRRRPPLHYHVVRGRADVAQAWHAAERAS